MEDATGYPATVTFIINHLWQATLFTLLASVIVLLLRRAPARLRYTVWILASLKFLIPSALLVFIVKQFGWDPSSLLLYMAWASDDPLGVVNYQHRLFFIAAPQQFWFADSVLKGVLLVWLAGTASILAVWLRRRFRFVKSISSGTLMNYGREFELLHQTKKRFRIRRRLRLLTSENTTEPGVYGIFRPTILLPSNMAGELRDAELQAVFLHELAHIARWDNLISHMHMIISAVFWFHPLVWWIDRQLLSEREKACDDTVIHYGGGSREYARGLLKVLQFGVGFRMAGVSCASGSDLKRRIEHIISQNAQKRLSMVHYAILAGTIAATLSVSVAAVELSECDRYTLRQRVSRLHQECDKTVPPASSCKKTESRT